MVLIRASAWLCGQALLRDFPSSAIGRPIVGFGAIRNPTGAAPFVHPAARRWSRLLVRTGGDLDFRPLFGRALPDVASIYLEPQAAYELASVMRGGASWSLALYPAAIAHRFPSCVGEGVWLITNNFSTGGAQSSARRFLLGLKARGVKVRAAVVEEHQSNPTAGRAALACAGGGRGRDSSGRFG